MSAVADEVTTLDVISPNTPRTAETGADAQLENYREVLAANREATQIEAESLDAFLDLLYAADPGYIDAAEYAVQSDPVPETLVDWESVSNALSESQAILIGVQKLLSETLANMGVEDHEFVRVYSQPDGSLRLVSDHPRRIEIETALNSPKNHDLRTLYQAAMSGMSLAGGLVGTASVPDKVLEQVKAKYSAA